MLYTLRFFFSSKCSLFHNANLFGSCIIHILHTVCAEIKKKNHSGAKGLIVTSIKPGNGHPNFVERGELSWLSATLTFSGILLLIFSGTGTRFSPSVFIFPLLISIPPVLNTHVTRGR